jgi:CTP:molybdopterin cytidylyltransferase MocA
LGKLLIKIGGGPLMKKLLMLATVLADVLVVAGHKEEGQLNPRRSKND